MWVFGVLTLILASLQVLTQLVLVTSLCLLPEKLLTFPPMTPTFFHSLC